MPRCNFDAVEAMDTGEFRRPGPGGYKVAIQSMEEGESRSGKKFVRLLFDIVDGEFKGYYSDDYAKEHPSTHKVDMYYESEGALRITKGRLSKIAKSNPGFDPEAAWNADNWQMFFGKQFGLVAGEREYVGTDGEVHTSLNWDRFITLDELAQGKYRIPGTEHTDGSKEPSYKPGEAPKGDGPKQPTPKPVNVPDSSIPF